MNHEPFKIAISAGEVSGDLRGATLITALHQQAAIMGRQCIVRGMGGDALKHAGTEIVIDYRRTGAVMGVLDVLKRLPSIFADLSSMRKLLTTWRPDVLILVDYPGFNLRLAKAAHKLGIPILYFIPPKVWAWKAGRVKLFQKYVDRVCSIFPFEPPFFSERGYEQVRFVGHPFTEEISYSQRKSEKSLHKIVALLPGSRRGEIMRHMSVALEALTELHQRHSEIRGIIPITSDEHKDLILSLCKLPDWITLTRENSLEIMGKADVGLLKSGTCNLEAAFLGLPFICFYKTNFINAEIGRRVIKVKDLSMVNILRPGSIPEYLQENAKPKEIAKHLEELLYNDTLRTTMTENLKMVVTSLHAPQDQDSRLTAADRTALEVLALAKKRKAENDKSIFFRTLHYLKPYTGLFVISLIAMVIYGMTDGVVPFLVKFVLDKVFQGNNTNYLYIFPVVLIAITILRALGDFGQQFLMGKIGHSIVRDMRNELNAHLLKMSPDYFISNSIGTLISRMTSDVVLLRTVLTDSLASLIRDSIRLIVLVIAAVTLDPFLSLLAGVALPLGIYPIHRFGKRLRSLSRTGQDAIGVIASTLNESIMGNRVVKIFGAEKFEQDRFEVQNESLTRTFVKSARVRALAGPVNEVLASFAAALVILYGGHAVMSQTRTQGDFIAFLIAVFLMYDPFKRLSNLSGTIHQALAGAQRIFEVLDTQPTIVDPPISISLSRNNTVEFNNVSFSYPHSQTSALKNISLNVSEGSRVAIVGPSGAGKSTLVDLVPRFIDPLSGSVRIGGVDVSKVTLQELRARIAMVGQHTFLFNDSIFNNIRYGKMDASREEIVEAAKTAYALEFIERLPQGFETTIGEGGFALSGGQRQRLAIARALLKNAPILILDEATASLDSDSEREVQAALERLQENRTSIIIAHRLSTVLRCDRIIVLNDGRIVEEGSHNDLVSKGGEYARVYSYQLGQ